MGAHDQAMLSAQTGGGVMSIVPYLVGLGGAVALLLTLLLIAHCLLYPIVARQAERDAFLDADVIAAAEANRRQYTVFGYRKRPRIPLFSKLLTALLFRRT
jgi:hypothetical protein